MATARPDTGRATGGRSWGADVAVVLGSLLIALAAAEIGLRVLDRFRPPSNPPRCGYWDPSICAMYAANPDYGYALQPSASTDYLYPEDDPRRLTVVSNRRGFRDDRELDDPDDRPRVLVLGDSFVFGEGVEARERFTDGLEDLLGYRVDSVGMTGWGPDLMLRALETVGPEARPDAVLLCLYTHDFRRVHPLYAGIGFEIPRYELRDGELVTVPYPAPSLWQKLRILWAVSPVRRSWDSGMWDVHRAILSRFRSLAAERDFRLGIVFLPGRADTPADLERREWLAAYSEEHGVSFLDLTGPVLDRPREEVFLPGGNPHWNPAGHALVAAVLAPFVERLVR
ncbi:MAG TPA: SGNH/GDSL hydrolase family protein [bacterium]|nr:SGNH/GDSL hydrolase family protein [bacterium]